MNLDDVFGELRSLRAELREVRERLRPTPKCLRPAQAAKLLGVGLTKMREMIARGDVRTVAVGKRRMVTLAEVERFLAAKEKTSHRAPFKRQASPNQDTAAFRAALRRR